MNLKTSDIHSLVHNTMPLTCSRNIREEMYFVTPVSTYRDPGSWTHIVHSASYVERPIYLFCLYIKHLSLPYLKTRDWLNSTCPTLCNLIKYTVSPSKSALYVLEKMFFAYPCVTLEQPSKSRN